VARHIDFLGILYLIWGGLAILLGCASFALAAGSAMIVSTGARGDQVIEAAAGLTAVTFALIGGVALVWGAIHAASGRALRRQRPWSRQATLALGIVNLVFLPFGTALGIYSLWVLLHEDARRLLP
jgi:uncharacterized membrane protein (DUF2068 family)